MTRRDLALGALLLAQLAGAGMGVLMTWHHEIALYGGVEAAGELIGCAASEKVDCDLVNTSAWSQLLGVPIATWGVATYLLLAGLVVVGWRGREEALSLVLWAGVATTAYSALLFGVSKLELGYVCSWCLRMYGVNVATPLLALLAGAARAPRPGVGVLGTSGVSFAVLALVAIAGERSYRAHLLGDAGSIDLGGAMAAVSPLGNEPQAEVEMRARTWQVETEDGNARTMAIRPTEAWKGNPDAKAVVVEYLDLECGHCKRLASEMDRLYPAYADRALFVVRHFPMDPACNPGVNNRKHRDACAAAVAAECAREQGRFWPFHDLAFKNQHALDEDSLALYAERAGVELSAWRTCIASDRAKQAVVADARTGAELDIHGTPRIFVNGTLHKGGRSAEQMARAIELALGTDAREAAVAARALREEKETIAPVPEDVPSMQPVEIGGRTFRIDTFEASLSGGVASSGKREIPATRMSWFAARDACEAAGRRLCTEEEWLAACQGAAPVDDDENGVYADDLVEGTTYPYGDHHDPRRCWDGRPRDGFRPVYTGEMPGCVSVDGVYDLTGNVEEWVGATPETAALMGGAFDTSKDHARCQRRNDTFGPGYATLRTGFRCCGD